VLAENVRVLAGYRRPGLLDEARLEHAFARVVDGEPLGVAERRLTGNGPAGGGGRRCSPCCAATGRSRIFPTAAGGLGVRRCS